MENDYLLQRLYNLECALRKIQNGNYIPMPSGCEPGYIMYLKDDGTWGCKDPDGGGPDPEPTTFVARWGWKSTSDIPTELEITTSPGFATFNNNSDVTANYSDAGGPQYLFMAEPVTQPQKGRWYASSINNELITSSSTFIIKGIVTVYRVYMTSFMTEFSSPIEFQKLT